MCWRVLQAGWSAVLVIGGDGTVLEVLNALMHLRACGGAAAAAGSKLAVGTIPAGSECAFAKMTTFVEAYAASWVLLKGHFVSAIDVMRITQVTPYTAAPPKHTHTHNRTHPPLHPRVH